MVLYFSDTRIKISSNSSYILVDEEVYHMPVYAKSKDDDIYLPAVPIFNILKQTVLPGLTYAMIMAAFRLRYFVSNRTLLSAKLLARQSRLMACPPSSVMPASNDTRVRVEVF